ncbi:MAG: hypothetical protein ABSB88_25385 [Bryobacteraceae bacterium]|jgi:hypothetical protein
MDQLGIPGSMGRLADGSAFFDRQEIMSHAWDLLKTSNLLFLAPRRVGKSSLLNRMQQDGEARGYKTLYLSVPDAEDELDFIKRLVRGFRGANWASGGWASAFRDRLPKDLEVVLKTGLIELKAKNFDWRGPADELETLLKSGDPETLLLVDELPLLIASIVLQDPSGNRAERFLLWLKRLREQYPPRWFFAGSIGLDSVARRLKLSGTIHDLQQVELGEFSPEMARAYLMSRGQFYEWPLNAETIDAILEAVEWQIPYHLNLVFEELRAAVKEGQGAPSPTLVEVALQRLIAHGRTHFDHWDERLAKILDGRIPRYCEIVLGLACHHAGGVTVESIDLRLSRELNDDQERAEMLRQVLDLLTSDGYLVRHEGAVHFRSAFLRRYWREVQA